MQEKGSSNCSSKWLAIAALHHRLTLVGTGLASLLDPNQSGGGTLDRVAKNGVEHQASKIPHPRSRIQTLHSRVRVESRLQKNPRKHPIHMYGMGWIWMTQIAMRGWCVGKCVSGGFKVSRFQGRGVVPYRAVKDTWTELATEFHSVAV